MTTREEAAAKAHYESGSFSEKWEMSQPALREFHLARMTDGIAAADTHDAAHGIHRVSLDDATVERAARALALSEGWDGLDWSMIPARYSKHFYEQARAVLTAAVEAEQ